MIFHRWSLPSISTLTLVHGRLQWVVRTVADLESSEHIQAAHVVEVIGYHSSDRKLWMF
ncbi:MAG TPA: hypothetical protein VH682_10555 [Gemmataceae bacterium]